MLNWGGSTLNLKLPFFNTHLHYLFYTVMMEVSTYFDSILLTFYFYCLVRDGPGLVTMRHNLIMPRQGDAVTWFVAYRFRKPITNIERVISYIYIYIYREFLASYFCDLSRCIQKFTEWKIMGQLSIRLGVRIFLIGWGQKMCVKHCYVDSSLWYEFRFAIVCIDMNIILDLSTAIQPDNLRRSKYWPIFAVKLNLHRRRVSARLDVLCPYFCLNPMVVHRKTYILMFLW